ncbi:glycosyltransferase family 2 protein [Flavobacterium aquidurense]|uniref:glycosyltransferase family 2 protein n=1 Tax=Flavobacterium aquidurense TaxID=362413 RepID=UPI00285C18C9|nr:glycosyltransferase family 2 protein [Flavobacterium aquidurense]MDR7372352.1 glycosyltransferase involved in cell wall biosynthesis [Flavobacterium aquidurense]
MDNNIKVTIITPSYNQGQFIEATIQSVLNQTYNNIEYIVLDACSTDQTSEILNKYADKISKIICEKDKGQSDAINKGFKMASGDLVGWINSDDILHSDCVERIVAQYKIDSNGSIYYNSKCDIIDKQNNQIGIIDRKISDRNFLLKIKYEVLQPGSFYSTDKVRLVNFLDENCHYCMDLDLWLKLLKHGGIIDIGGSPIAGYREWELTKTSTGAEKFYKNIYEVLRRHGAGFLDRSVRNAILLYFKNIVKSKLH